MLGGTSAAHHRFPTGTVAIGVSDRWFPWVRYVLSCNHVLALINGARVGDPVVQPAPGDGGVVWRDVVASVVRFVPLRFGSRADNLVDAAVAVTPGGEVLDAVAWLGRPRRVRPALSVRPGERVVKVGRSSGLTTGRVTAVDVSVVIAYPWVGQVAHFSRQIVTTGMCAYGDSGSLLFDGRGDALGMLFAGTPTHTMYNALEYVENELGVAVAARPFQDVGAVERKGGRNAQPSSRTWPRRKRWRAQMSALSGSDRQLAPMAEVAGDVPPTSASSCQ